MVVTATVVVIAMRCRTGAPFTLTSASGPGARPPKPCWQVRFSPGVQSGMVI